MLSRPLAAATADGYLSAFSVAQGEQLRLYVSSDAPAIDVRVYQIGNPDREMMTQPGVVARQYSIPADGWSTGAQWPEFLVLSIPSNWPSGLYRIALVAGGKELRSLNFVVRDDQPGSQAKIVVLDNAPTQAAYNNWGGKSLYTFNSTNNVAAVSVSLRRPGNHTALAQELEFVRWASSVRVPLEYVSMLDLHSNAQLLSHYKVAVIVGHNEYWTKEMRDQLEAFLATGGSAIILGGATPCGGRCASRTISSLAIRRQPQTIHSRASTIRASPPTGTQPRCCGRRMP